MPGITDPAEEYFKDGLWAWDPAGGVWLKLIIDPLTNRLVVDHPGDIEVVQPVPADLCVANYGWDGAAWRKLPLIWGYSDVWEAQVAETNAPGAGATLRLPAVDVGEIWVVQAASAVDIVTAPGWASIRVVGATYTNTIAAKNPLLLSEYVIFSGQMVLKAGDLLEAYFFASVAGDDLYFMARGYKMKVAE